MWRNPLLIAGQGEVIKVDITERTAQADLYVLLGQPSAPANWEITIDGVDMLGFRIESTFPAGSTFSFILINGARIVGYGGLGGNGATVSTYEVGGARGGDGGAAIQSVFDVSVNCDGGYLLGGGGGGGGGATYHITNTSPQVKVAGSGGGGGAGFGFEVPANPSFPSGYFTSSPGIAGTGNFGTEAPVNGGFGNFDSPGVGGNVTNEGGDGGVLGSAGQIGWGTNPSGLVPTLGFDGTGGCGGNAGEAFYGLNGASMTLTGAKSEATLRAEGRIKGQSKAPYFTGGTNTGTGTSGNEQRYINSESVAASSVHGFTFKSDGSLQYLNGVDDPIRTDLFMKGTGLVGADFQVRQVSGPGVTLNGTWDSEAAAINTWIDLSADRTWSFTHGGGASIRGTLRLFEIRRADVPSNPDTEIIGRLWLYAIDYGGL